MKHPKTAEDVDDLIDTLAENLATQATETGTRSAHELARWVFPEGQLLVLYRTGSALVQGRGSKTNIAEICRALGWRCKG